MLPNLRSSLVHTGQAWVHKETPQSLLPPNSSSDAALSEYDRGEHCNTLVFLLFCLHETQHSPVFALFGVLINRVLLTAKAGHVKDARIEIQASYVESDTKDIVRLKSSYIFL